MKWVPAVLTLGLLGLGGLLAVAFGIPQTFETGSAAPSGPMSCSVKSTPDAGDVEVFRMSSTTNAHAGTPGGSAYGERVYCGGVQGLGSDCSGVFATVLKLSAPDNAHAESDGDYSTEVCLSGGDDATVGVTYGPTGGVGYTCLATMSGTTNAHVADCDGVNDYPTGVWVLVTPDNCPTTPNPGQANEDAEDQDNDTALDEDGSTIIGQIVNGIDDDADTLIDEDPTGDSAGDLCDPDDENDGVYDEAEGMPAFPEIRCEGDSLDTQIRPERVDSIFVGVSDDTDAVADEALPAGAGVYDCDGDGYTGDAEDHVYSYNGQTDGDQKTCQEYDLSHPNPNSEIKPSLRWPSDFNKDDFPLDSFNKITLLDIVSFLAPVKYFRTDVGTNPGDVRWDLRPGKQMPFAFDIDLPDLVALIAGDSGNPPMLNGAKAFGGPPCPWPP